MKVLVFDSGKGGEYVARQASKRFPNVDFDFLADEKGMPYSSKTNEEIIESAQAALQPKINGYEVIVIACHTLTEIGIDNLRKQYPNKTFVGFDPGIKKAFDLGFRGICVLATPPTLQSKRYKELKDSLDFKRVIEPDCSTWAAAIEDEIFDVKLAIKEIIQAGCSCVVLACTHYFLFEDELSEYFDDLVIINPTNAVLDQLGRLLTAS